MEPFRSPQTTRKVFRRNIANYLSVKRSELQKRTFKELERKNSTDLCNAAKNNVFSGRVECVSLICMVQVPGWLLICLGNNIFENR